MPEIARRGSAVGGILTVSFEFLLLASSHRIPLQTSNVQAVNGTTGAAMSLIKKSDVKNHLSTRTGASSVPAQPDVHSDPTGYSEDGSKDYGVSAAAPGEVSGAVQVTDKPKA